ncbi:hypothetical protein IAR50_004893 [Cryptococcus sp. DSM 104548]
MIITSSDTTTEDASSISSWVSKVSRPLDGKDDPSTMLEHLEDQVAVLSKAVHALLRIQEAMKVLREKDLLKIVIAIGTLEIDVVHYDPGNNPGYTRSRIVRAVELAIKNLKLSVDI